MEVAQTKGDDIMAKEELIKTDKMVQQVMQSHAPELEIEFPEPFIDRIDTSVLFDLSAFEWAKFFGAVMMVSFAIGFAYGGMLLGYEYFSVSP